eukprot:scaffold34964_cov44-Phaeocystis_antarctica.AAC.1
MGRRADTYRQHARLRAPPGLGGARPHHRHGRTPPAHERLDGHGHGTEREDHPKRGLHPGGLRRHV